MASVFVFLNFLCIFFSIWFVVVVSVDAARMFREAKDNGVEYDKPKVKVFFGYLRVSFHYHFPML